MSKHSRAPWKTHLINETVVVSADGEIVARIEGDYDNDAERMAADARLIAAAPALLEALEKAVEVLEFCYQHGVPPKEIAQARAAIAAAKGDV